jgi:predicted sugar kinase
MIEVRTSARLHLGLLDNNGEQGRLYGSIGVAISEPQLVLRAEESSEVRAEGMEAERISRTHSDWTLRANTGAHCNAITNSRPRRIRELNWPWP